MNCSQAQDQLFAADGIDASVDAALAEHLAGCEVCSELVGKIGQIESLVRELPVEGSVTAKNAFLARLQKASNAVETPLNPSRRDRAESEDPGRAAQQPGNPRVRFQLVPGVTRALYHRSTHWLRSAVISPPRLALAASVLLVVGLVIGLLGYNAVPKASASDAAIVDQLVEMDVRLASAESLEERGKIFSISAAPIKAAIAKGNLSRKDRELAQKLLDTGNSLTTTSDPLHGAQQFADVADLLLNHMKAAMANDDVLTLRRLTQNYALVSSVGLGDQLNRAKQSKVSHVSKKDRDIKLEEMLRKDAKLRARLQQLLEESPDASRKEIYKALKVSRAPRKHVAPATHPTTKPY